MAGSEDVAGESSVAEEDYLGIRSSRGLALRPSELARVAPWIDAGWAVLSRADRMRLTALGWLRLDALAADLTLVRSHY